MSFQILPPTEALSAEVAVIGFLPCVDSLVFFQITGLNKSSTALHATIRLLSCVTSLVDLQISEPTECLSANNAHVYVITPDVLHPQFPSIKDGPVGFGKPMPPVI